MYSIRGKWDLKEKCVQKKVGLFEVPHVAAPVCISEPAVQYMSHVELHIPRLQSRLIMVNELPFLLHACMQI